MLDKINYHKPLCGYENSLKRLGLRGLLRSFSGANGIDFTSNDYLSLATHKRMQTALVNAIAQDVPIGAGASRLLRGNHPEHTMLEEEAALFFKAHKALYFNSGFLANYAILTTLPQKKDLVILDSLVHASTYDGARAGRAEMANACHNNPQYFNDIIKAWRVRGGKGRPWIVVESIYSMDGDFAPLTDLLDIADSHDGFLLIDEAHATGIFGIDGKGLSANFAGRENIIVLHTCSKAMGTSGAVVCLSETLQKYLINRSRPFIYSTAPSPLIAATVRESLRILRDEPERREQIMCLIKKTKAELNKLELPASNSQIQPVIIGDSSKTMQLASTMQAHGFDIRGIRPPTVPNGSARLRISITLNVDQKKIMSMLKILKNEILNSRS